VAHVLVVEDNPVSAVTALKQLRALGCQGTAVTSGVEAVEAVKHEAFDLILMDCRLPGMDGFETTRVIRNFERTTKRQRVPIVAVTVENDSDVRDRCVAAGMDTHVPKPSSMNDLRDMLERFTD
jgi:CheY-like chemotaxis protein